MLAPSELVNRLQTVLSAAERLTQQIPGARLDRQLPIARGRSGSSVAHIAQIAEAFLDLVEHGKRLEYAAYNQDVPGHVKSKADLLGFVESTRLRLQSWSRTSGASHGATAAKRGLCITAHQSSARVSRADHMAQRAARETARLGRRGTGHDADRPLGDAELAGLPLPTHAWDDKLEFSVREPAGSLGAQRYAHVPA
jgi:hypothetical protein